MTLCIKQGLFDHKKLCEGKINIFNENKIFQLNYKYDKNVYGKFYLLTDWIEITKVKKYDKYIEIQFINKELKKIFNDIDQKLMFYKNNTNNADINLVDLVDLVDSDDDLPIENQEIKDNQPQNIKLVTLMDDTVELDEDTQKYFYLRFNKISELTLHPSKKSGLEEYKLNKIENYNEITRYFPTINKAKEDFKIVGKFLIYANIYYLNDSTYGETFFIKSGHIKYEKTYISNDKLHIKSIYDNQIKIEI